MSRFQFPPPAPVSFPIAATTVTDNFNRANENPIGAPWDTSSNPSEAAALVSNHMTSLDRTGWWSGEASYVGPFINCETILKVSTDLGLLSGSQVSLELSTYLGSEAISYIVVDLANTIRFGSSLPEQITPVSFSVGDEIGLRFYGQEVTGWYNPIGGSWQLVGSGGRLRSTPPYRGDITIYLYADDGPITISEFRVAEVGELIPQKPVSGSGRNSW